MEGLFRRDAGTEHYNLRLQWVAELSIVSFSPRRHQNCTFKIQSTELRTLPGSKFCTSVASDFLQNSTPLPDARSHVLSLVPSRVLLQRVWLVWATG